MYPTRYFEPEAVGCLVAETVRCGKGRCRCRWGKPHGPYWYLYYRAWDGRRWRLRKRYVPADQLEEARRRLERAKAGDRAISCLFGRARTLRAAIGKILGQRITEADLMEICDGI